MSISNNTQVYWQNNDCYNSLNVLNSLSLPWDDFGTVTYIHAFMQSHDFMRFHISVQGNISGKHTDTKTDLLHHPFHLQYPEIQANLCLPSLQTHQEVRSDRLDLDDPEAGREQQQPKKK